MMASQTWPRTGRPGEIRSLAAIAASSVDQPGNTARQVQAAVSARVFAALGPLGVPVRLVQERVADTAFNAVSAALRAPLELGGRALATAASSSAPALSDAPRSSLALGALNGLFGDRLARLHPDLAFEMSVRVDGRDMPVGPDRVAAAFPDATPRLVFFLHGLCETDEAWHSVLPRARAGRRSYGDRLRDELGYTPIYVRYNTGRHISDNGRAFAELLDAIVSSWPGPVEEIALVGHSMGGLVARSACHYASLEEHACVDHVRHVFCLGTPHLGAPLEKAANIAAWPLNRLPETRPFGDLFFNRRSAGIKDLRFGNILEEDWSDHDPDEFLRDRCREVPFLRSATYYFVGATLSRGTGGVGSVVGDLLVRFPSASGAGRRRRIPFGIENGRHIGGLHHLQLLNDPAVYGQIRGWLEDAPD